MTEKKQKVPVHIAIIMDGNGRWAQEKGLSRTAGHKEGVKRVREIVKASVELGIKVLTLFAFSNENWTRPPKEVQLLMGLFGFYIQKEADTLNKNNIRFMAIGRRELLPARVLESIRKAEEKTRKNSAMTLVLALNYGSRQEIVDAAKNIAYKAGLGSIKAEDIDEEYFSSLLYTKDLPDPDLLIRTSGEQRISNFLLWQASYAEMYFVKKYWPDFTKDDLHIAIEEFSNRQRRFGNIK